jgi:O-antigen/teichoic acid export membrane protein
VTDARGGGAVDPDLPTSLTRHTAGAALWTFAQKWGIRVFTVFTLALLTRELGPDAFGVVAAALVFLPILNLLVDLGFSTYVVQADRVDQRMLSTAFWFSTASGLGLAAVTVALAPLIGRMLGVPDFAGVLRGLAPVIACSGLMAVPAALLRRRLEFRAVAVRQLAAAVSSQIVAVILALAGAGVWALVAQYVTNIAVACVAVWIAARWRPSFEFSTELVRTMAGFGIRVVGSDVVGVVRGWLENIILISVVGVAGLGYWSIATRLVLVVTDLSSSTLVSVSSAVFARIRNDQPRLTSGYRRTVAVVYAVVGSILAFLAAVSPIMVPLFFGDKWGPSIVLAQLYALASIFVVGANVDRGLFLGSGRPGMWLWYVVAIDALTLAGTALSARHGMSAVAATFLGVAIFGAGVRLFLVGRLLEASVRQLGGQVVGLVAISMLTAAPAWGVTVLLRGQLPDFLLLCVAGLIEVVVVVLVLRMLSPAVLQDILTLAPESLRRKAQVWLRRLGVPVGRAGQSPVGLEAELAGPSKPAA